MFSRVAVVLLLAGSAWASVWRTNFIIDRFLPTIGLVEIPLHDVSFDVDHKEGTFSGFVEFHLQNGKLGNLHQRVRRRGDCNCHDWRKLRRPHYTVYCDYSLRGLVAKYNGQVIIDRKSQWMATELLVDYGRLYTITQSHLGTEVLSFEVRSVHGKLMPVRQSMDFPAYVMKQFEKEVVSRVSTEIAHGLNTTYKEAVVAKIASLKGDNFSE